jgi:hypothetical protein
VLRDRNRNRQRNWRPIAVHRSGRNRSSVHDLAINLHYQEVILRRPRANIGLLHLSVDISHTQFATCVANEETNAAGKQLRFPHVKNRFIGGRPETGWRGGGFQWMGMTVFRSRK